jgi:hypothetical protein
VKFRLDIYSNKVCCNKSIIKTGEIGETKNYQHPYVVLEPVATSETLNQYVICVPICTLNQMQHSRHRIRGRWLNLMLAVCSRQSIFMVVTEKSGWLWAHMF